MDVDHSVFRRSEAGWHSAPDFGALVAFLAAAQAAQPTARLACKLAQQPEFSAAPNQALIALFARNGRQSAGLAALTGRFNPSVPFPDRPVTSWKAP